LFNIGSIQGKALMNQSQNSGTKCQKVLGVRDVNLDGNYGWCIRLDDIIITRKNLGYLTFDYQNITQRTPLENHLKT
jgi:hypothetical protein